MRKKREDAYKRVNLKLNEEVHRAMLVYCAANKISVQSFVEKTVIREVKSLAINWGYNGIIWDGRKVKRGFTLGKSKFQIKIFLKIKYGNFYEMA